MSDSDDSLPLEVHKQIGKLREEFEDALLELGSPQIEEFLPRIVSRHRPALLRELLRLELDYRNTESRHVNLEAYMARFSDQKEVVEGVFSETRGHTPCSEQPLGDDLPTFGPYVASRQLGKGGFGTVYLATHEETGHQVAIKVGSELLHEAKTLLTLKHPSIIRVLHVGRDASNRRYLVMDYMRGGSLRDKIGTLPIAPEEAVRITARIVEALHAAHTHSEHIYHRDLKPENVLFDEDDDVCVADFGLALSEVQQEGRRGDYSGTLAYQSPEQVRGQADWIDARSDIWSVGVMMYEMMTGQRPFTDADLREQILHRSVKSPRTYNEQIPDALEAICLKCLKKDPSDRYQSADMLLRALRGQELERNPYKGLESFEESDEDRFYGRDEQVERLRKKFAELYRDSLQDSSFPRILPVLGPSGCGKSSLVKAGLAPALRREQFPNRRKTRVEVFRPRMRPLKSLADVLDRLAGGAEDAGIQRAQRYAMKMASSELGSAHEDLWWIIDSLPSINDSPLVLVVDQFEELFTECEDEQERAAFIGNLLYAATQKDGLVSVVFTFRSDFLHETQQFERLNEIIALHGQLIPAMKESELRKAISEPAKRAGYELDHGVVSLLVNETKNREGALPLLQLMLARIWDGLRNGENPATTYQRLGGIGGVLAAAADAVFEGLSENEQRIARRVFLGLVKVGEAQDTKRIATFGQLLSHRDDPAIVRSVLGKFSTKYGRFITLKQKAVDNSGSSAGTQAELTHEALLENWQRLRTWINNSRSDLSFKSRLSDAAIRWHELGRHNGSLWRPPELDILRERLPSISEDLNTLEKDFVDAAIEADIELSQQEVTCKTPSDGTWTESVGLWIKDLPQLTVRPIRKTDLLISSAAGFVIGAITVTVLLWMYKP